MSRKLTAGDVSVGTRVKLRNAVEKKDSRVFEITAIHYNGIHRNGTVDVSQVDSTMTFNTLDVNIFNIFDDLKIAGEI
jgi:hypothetical protein